MLPKFQNSKKYNAGFTLVEILVVVAIIGIFSTTTYVMLTRFNGQQNITIAEKNLKNDLAEAKANALSHVVDRCKTGAGNVPGVLEGYQITFNTVARSYSLQEVCDQNNPSTPDQTPLNPIKTKTLPKGVSFVSVPAAGYIRFNTLAGGSSGGQITIRSSDVTGNITIQVNAAGIIQ